MSLTTKNMRIIFFSPIFFVIIGVALAHKSLVLGGDSAIWFLPVFSLFFDGLKNFEFLTYNFFDNAGVPLSEIYIQHEIFQLANLIAIGVGLSFGIDSIDVVAIARLIKLSILSVGVFLLLANYAKNTVAVFCAMIMSVGTTIFWNGAVQPGVADMFYLCPLLIYLLLMCKRRSPNFFLMILFGILGQSLHSYFSFLPLFVFFVFSLAKLTEGPVEWGGHKRNILLLSLFSGIFLFCQYSLVNNQEILSVVRLVSNNWQSNLPNGGPHFVPLSDLNLEKIGMTEIYEFIAASGTFISPRQYILMLVGFAPGYSEVSLFVGPVIFLLFLIGFENEDFKKDFHFKFWLLCLLSSFVICLGSNTYYFRVLGFVPGGDMLRHTHLFQNLFLLSFGYFAIRGANRITKFGCLYKETKLTCETLHLNILFTIFGAVFALCFSFIFLNLNLQFAERVMALLLGAVVVSLTFLPKNRNYFITKYFEIITACLLLLSVLFFCFPNRINFEYPVNSFDPDILFISLSVPAIFLSFWVLISCRCFFILGVAILSASVIVGFSSGFMIGSLFNTMLIVFLIWNRFTEHSQKFSLISLILISLFALEFIWSYNTKSPDLWRDKACIGSLYREFPDRNTAWPITGEINLCNKQSPMRYSGGFEKTYRAFSSYCASYPQKNAHDGCNYPLIVNRDYANKIRSEDYETLFQLYNSRRGFGSIRDMFDQKLLEMHLFENVTPRLSGFDLRNLPEGPAIARFSLSYNSGLYLESEAGEKIRPRKVEPLTFDLTGNSVNYRLRHTAPFAFFVYLSFTVLSGAVLLCLFCLAVFNSCRKIRFFTNA